ncbi:hypothetical protein Droror1_Dr00000999 [Drosera rotundifolia]
MKRASFLYHLFFDFRIILTLYSLLHNWFLITYLQGIYLPRLTHMTRWYQEHRLHLWSDHSRRQVGIAGDRRRNGNCLHHLYFRIYFAPSQYLTVLPSPSTGCSNSPRSLTTEPG